MKTRTKKILYAAADVVFVLIAIFVSGWLLDVDFSTFSGLDKGILLLTCILAIPVFFVLGLYDAVIRYLSFKAVFTVIKSVSVYCILFLLAVSLFADNITVKLVLVVYFLLLLLVGASRFLRSWQFAYYGEGYGRNKNNKNVLIYGAGTAGVQLATILSYGNQHTPRAFIDDSPDLQDRVVEGHKVYSSQSTQEIIDKYNIDEILLAIPSASRNRRNRILRELEPLRVHVRSLPSLEEIVNCEVKIDDIREVDMMDLLGRDPVPADESLLEAPILGKNVLVTGAAGSIGSELCRQIIKRSPNCLVLVEQHEFSLYQLSNELDRLGVQVISVLGSVTDSKLIQRIIKKYQLDTIYHAAAYKHVPMVEHNPNIGVVNNVLGTYVVAKAACDTSVENFVLISTDKAVRPTNVMGASKRVAELVIQAMDKDCQTTQFSAVRFGNVIGSSGSVIPRFRDQIKNGGPVTVTHKDITRFFMTVPEAAELVIQAGALGRGGDIFVLEMGEPVKIDDMARHMIQLSGLTVVDEANIDGDIEIVYKGLRSGEKLYEELLIDGDVEQTQHSRIMCANESSIDIVQLESYVSQLKDAAEKNDIQTLKNLLSELVDGYQAETSS